MDPKNLLVVHCDGGARGNPGPAAGGAVIEDIAGKKRFLCGKYLGKATNNQAEYASVKLAYEVITKNYGKKLKIDFYLDSLLVAKQLSGLFKVKNVQLQKTVFEIRALETGLGEIYYHHVRREENKEADKLVNKALDERSSFVLTETI